LRGGSSPGGPLGCRSANGSRSSLLPRVRVSACRCPPAEDSSSRALNVLEREIPRRRLSPERFLHVMWRRKSALCASPEARRSRLHPGAEDGSGTWRPRIRRRVWQQIGERATPVAQVLLRSRDHPHLAVDEEGNAIALTPPSTTLSAPASFEGRRFLAERPDGRLRGRAGRGQRLRLRGGAENAGAGKVPLSSMAPTLLFAPDGALLLAIGLQVIHHSTTLVQHRASGRRQDAVDRAIAQRIHHNLFRTSCVSSPAESRRPPPVRWSSAPKFSSPASGSRNTAWFFDGPGKACG